MGSDCGRGLRAGSALKGIWYGLAVGCLLVLMWTASADAAGELYGFGENTYGSLGSPLGSVTATPRAIAGFGEVRQAAAGYVFSLALNAEGLLYAFGQNGEGQLGSTTLTSVEANPVLVTLPGMEGHITHIASGGSSSLASTSTGQLFGFGDNYFGQLGLTTNNLTNTAVPPTKVPLPGMEGQIAALAAGFQWSLVLTSSGQLYAFGENTSGQLGNSEGNGTSTVLEAHPTPKLVSLPGQVGKVTQIAAGGFYTLALTSSGQLYSFGYNETGMLGYEANAGTRNPNPTPTRVSLPGMEGDITVIGAGAGQSLVATSGGQLYTFGDNFRGELGRAINEGTLTPNPTPTLVSLPGIEGHIKQLAGGEFDSLVVTSAGQLYAFGDNRYGELGKGTSGSEPEPEPTLVSLPEPVESVASGSVGLQTLVVTGKEGVSIAAGEPVAEPASATAQATFTISLPEESKLPVTVHYKTLDGTAKASANAYTAIPDGEVTIPAGQTSAQIHVQVDGGSGVANAPTEGFQVELTSSSEFELGTTTATGVITIPGITGKFTDGTGAPLAGYPILVSGTATSGQAVSRELVTEPNGRYQLYVDPGTYTLTPEAPRQSGAVFEAVGCPGKDEHGVCAGISLGSGASLIADFRLSDLVVNSTADTYDPQSSLEQDVCDTTPSASEQTCTLRAAIEVANRRGGGTITFDIPGGGVPVIRSSDYLPVTAPTVIDGTTQPGPHEVTVMGVRNTPGFDAIAQGVTLRGLTIYGFDSYDVALIGGDDTLERDQLGTIGGSPSLYSGIVHDERGGHNVIQGNTIGGPPPDPGRGDKLLSLESPGDTIGGGLPGQGNVILNGAALITGAGDVIQGNTFTDAEPHVGENATVGGPTPLPGTGVGNDMSNRDGPGLVLESGDVVQGNHVHDSQSGIEVQNGARNTIGGATPEMGNLIEHNGTGSNFAVARAGIGIGEPRVLGGSHNVIENNQIIDNAGDGGVSIYGGVGNQVIENEMSGNLLGINLGGGTFLYENASHPGPNDYQPYPQLYTIGAHAGLHITGRLNASPDRTYTIELYSQPSCAIDSVTPGEGLHYLGRRVLPTRTQFTLAFPAASPGQHAVTATATADDGSTSEFSPCLTIGHSARSFSQAGVTPTSSNVPITTTTKTARPAAARKAAKTKTTAHGVLQLLCPPLTTGSCTGMLVLATTGRRPVAFVRNHFKLAPGRGETITFTLPAGLLSRLERAHRLAAKATITAHDAAKHHNHKTTVTELTLRLAPHVI